MVAPGSIGHRHGFWDRLGSFGIVLDGLIPSDRKESQLSQDEEPKSRVVPVPDGDECHEWVLEINSWYHDCTWERER